MADLPKIGLVERRAVRIDVPAHWLDHHFQGRPVLPAVEAMQLLAFWVRDVRPSVHVRSIRSARFEKFLELPHAGASIEAFCDMTDLPDGAVQAALLTRGKTGPAGITRTRTHAQVTFAPAPLSIPAIALDMAAALTGSCFRVAPEHLYASLVPLGPAYRNISRPVHLSRDGALALLRDPGLPDPQTDRPLGSPFIADAALHAACVWSQRFAGVVAFPVGIQTRQIVDPVRPGETYIGRVFPLRSNDKALVFDIWILDARGRLCELLKGVRMRDVSGGGLRPAQWISATSADRHDVFTGSKDQTTMILIERDTVMPFADRCLTHREALRLEKMGPGRRNAFMAARLACKRLSRLVSGNTADTPARAIETLAEDGIRSICLTGTGHPPLDCSLAHDRRFAVAAAGPSIGVDVERPNARLNQAVHLFTSANERTLMRAVALDPHQSAVRIWSIKESVAKALNIPLADAWHRTEVIGIGVEQSALRIDAGAQVEAYHREVDGHVVTWVCAVPVSMPFI
jgi:phosphopantetheinyl transferase